MRYLIASYYQQPGGKYNESVKVDDKVRNKDMMSASIILDYKERKVVKCRFQGELGGPKTFDSINKFYKGHYLNIISQIEAKYEVLNAAKEIVSTVVNDVPETDDAE